MRLPKCWTPRRKAWTQRGTTTILDGGKYHQMKRTLELELDFITDLSPLELASKVAPLISAAIESVKRSVPSELEFDIFFVLAGHEVLFVMEPV